MDGGGWRSGSLRGSTGLAVAVLGKKEATSFLVSRYRSRQDRWAPVAVCERNAESGTRGDQVVE